MARTLPDVDQVGEGGQRLVDVRAVVGTVHLVEVDVVGAQAPEAAFDGAGDPTG